MKYLLVAIMVFAMSGCLQMGKLDYSKFEPLVTNSKNQQFKFTVKSNIFNPADDPESEKERMQWLQIWLDDNHICPNGYEILNRNPVALGYYESVKIIYYLGQCK